MDDIRINKNVRKKQHNSIIYVWIFKDSHIYGFWWQKCWENTFSDSKVICRCKTDIKLEL